MVYVLNKNGQPLMPTERHGKVRRMLNDGRAKVIQAKPFTIQLTYDTTNYTQPITLGVDAGYQTIGFSVISKEKELISGDLYLLEGMSQCISDRAKYRRQRRNHLRYREPRFNNRKKPKDWLAPSIQHKLDSHIKLISKIKTLLPITQTIIEVANALNIEQVRRNNRILQKFYDAKYIDIRTGEKTSGQKLNCGRRVRNKSLNGPNLHIYRGKKISRGRINIRRQRYMYQPRDIVIYNDQQYTVKGVQNLGDYIKLTELSKPVKIEEVEPLRYSKGFYVA